MKLCFPKYIEILPICEIDDEEYSLDYNLDSYWTIYVPIIKSGFIIEVSRPCLALIGGEVFVSVDRVINPALIKLKLL